MPKQYATYAIVTCWISVIVAPPANDTITVLKTYEYNWVLMFRPMPKMSFRHFLTACHIGTMHKSFRLICFSWWLYFCSLSAIFTLGWERQSLTGSDLDLSRSSKLLTGHFLTNKELLQRHPTQFPYPPILVVPTKVFVWISSNLFMLVSFFRLVGLSTGILHVRGELLQDGQAREDVLWCWAGLSKGWWVCSQADHQSAGTSRNLI